MKIYIATLFILLPSLTVAQGLQTKVFKTDFIAFKLSNQWDCNQEESEYVCRPTSDAKKREALIVIAAKIPGKDDNLKAFFEYLKKSKKITDFEGRTVASKVNTIKYKEIQSTQWVDAIHLSSELKDFYTRYLATVKNGIAILVTYSVLQSRHSAYVAELNRMITSIEVLARPPQLAAPPVPKKPGPKIQTGDRPTQKQ